MAVKYVKDFAYDSGFGFTGSSGKTPVKSHMRSPMKKNIGGVVKSKGFDNSTRNPISKFPDIAPAMVEKRSQGLGGLAKETKKLASYDKPHMEGKKGAKVPMYAKGGAVKKAHAKKAGAKKEMPSFLKAKMMKKADGGEVDRIPVPTGENVPVSPLAQMGDEPPFDRTKYNNWYEDPRYLPEAPPEQPDRYISLGDRIIPSIPGNIGPEFPLMTTMPVPDGPRLRSEVVRGSPLAQMARRRAMMAGEDAVRTPRDSMMARRPMPARRAMPVAPKAPMIESGRRMPMAREDMVREPRGMVNRLRNQIARRVRPAAPKAEPIMGGLLPPITPPKLPEYTGPTYKPGDIVYDALGQPGYVNFPVSPENRLTRGQPIPPGGYAKGGRVSKGEKKIGKVMGEFKRGELHSGSKKGPVVKNPKQAVAIALSEARSAGAKIPKKKAMGGRACD